MKWMFAALGLLVAVGASGAQVTAQTSLGTVTARWTDAEGNTITTSYLGDTARVEFIVPLSALGDLEVYVGKDVAYYFDKSVATFGPYRYSAGRNVVTAPFVPDEVTGGSLRGYYSILKHNGKDILRFGTSEKGTELQVKRATTKTYNVVYPSTVPGGTGDLVGAVRDAIQYWNSGGNGRLPDKVRLVQATGTQIPDVTIEFVQAPGSDWAGQATLPEYYSASLMLVGLGEVVRGTWVPYSTEVLTHVAKHELGHSLGLQHSQNLGDIMYPAIPASLPRYAPTPTPALANPQGERGYASQGQGGYVSPQRSPGFEVVIAVGALGVALSLWRKGVRR